MKDDLAGGKLPSDDFGENASWWWIMILAHNLNAMMKKFFHGRILVTEENESHPVFLY